MSGNNDKNFIVIFGSVFGGIGLVLLVAGLVVYTTVVSSQEHTQLVRGKVVRLSAGRGSKGGTVYTPVVEFSFNNQIFQIYGSVASSPPSFDVGEEVELFVNPQSPQTASINSFMENWFAVLVLGILGSVFSAIGIFLLINVWKNRNKLK